MSAYFMFGFEFTEENVQANKKSIVSETQMATVPRLLQLINVKCLTKTLQNVAGVCHV